MSEQNAATSADGKTGTGMITDLDVASDRASMGEGSKQIYRVSQLVQYEDWCCIKCSSMKLIKGKQKYTGTKPKLVRKNRNKEVTKKPGKPRKRKSIEEQSDVKINGKNTEYQLRAKEQVGNHSKAGSVKSTVSNSVKARLELKLRKLEAEQTILDEKRKLLDEQLSVMEELAELQSERGSKSVHEDCNSRVHDWLSKEFSEKMNISQNESESSKANELDESEETSSCEEDESGDSTDESDQDEADLELARSFCPKKRSTPKDEGNKRMSREHNSATKCKPTSCILTRNQLAARQIVSKELPIFTGNPEEWPMFLSTYENTTSMCGFRDDENMIRLRNCLKGNALTSVRSFLLHPSTVDKAMAALKLRFGQPHSIINALKEKILCIPPLKPDAIDKLIDFALAVQNLYATIGACGHKEYLRDVSLLQELVAKLPPSIRLDWARQCRNLRKVNLAAFSKWVYTLAEDACLVVGNTDKQQFHDQYGPRKGKATLNVHSELAGSSLQYEKSPKQEAPTGALDNENTASCAICRGECQSLERCQKFQNLSYDEKWAAVREFKVCRKCLKNHKGGCNYQPCGRDGCIFKHHPLLHKVLKAESPITCTPNGAQSCNTHRTQPNSNLFRYVPVVLHGKQKSVECYAFLDDGSELTLIDQEIANELELAGIPRPLCLKWTGGTERYEAESQSVDLFISGQNGKRYLMDDVRTVQELQLPRQTLDVERLQNLHPYLRGIPVQSYRDVCPRILIGVKHASVSLVRKSREGQPSQPIAIKTNVGWIVYGGSSTEQSVTLTHFTNHECSCDGNHDDALNRTMKEYFNLDSLGVTRPVKDIRSRDDEYALNLLNELTRINGQRFETGLLWRQGAIRLPDSKSMALQRFKSLEKRMERDEILSHTLNEKIANYRAKGYIRKLESEEINRVHEHVWYLPVFPVTNPNKPGKVRIVWDAAACSYGISLNSALLTGPDLLVSLISVLYKFRERRFAICGDICEMFHQIRIRREDQNFQRFLWRDDCTQKEPSVFVMQVMTFGACCSPCSAQFVKNHNAERFAKDYPEAVNAIIKSTYVDDMLCSVDTEDEAVRLAQEVYFVHKQGGFEIRNWMSNSPRVLAALNEDQWTEKSLDLTSDLATEKVLGMWWCTASDCFTFKINWHRFDENILNGSRHPTKREVLRTLMTIYDPIGLISHYLMFLKVLLQDIWRSSVGWDDAIEETHNNKWRTWLKLLPQVENLKIPRCYLPTTIAGDLIDVQLHTFVDASELGMSAVVYLRIERGARIECSLVGSKTRVAPIKYLTIPGLELQAAVIGARLADSIAGSLSIKISRRFFWSDSRNVLSWLRADHRRYSQFVAARVSEVLELTELKDWRWVPTKQNVADEGTKWQRQPSLTIDSRWFNVPTFLHLPETEWVVTPLELRVTEEELRVTVHTHIKGKDPILLAKDFSSWRRLIRVTAYVLRFINNVHRNQLTKTSSYLSGDEIKRAEEYHFRQAQKDAYPAGLFILKIEKEEQAKIRKNPRNSSIYGLNAVLDHSGLIRMKGRAGACPYLDAEAISPIILPWDHHITKLAVIDFHEKYHHQNQEAVINEVKQRFCIPRLRRLYGQIRSSCQRCKIRDANPQPPAMADLPPCRLAAYDRPFTHTGVDYFGPMEVTVGRRVEKGGVSC
ncbi:uncharacterized protein LOC131680649 [Topomyia yanbarensis]|uniref:uncharacterized protein LOC131680649 n=1 Tax=Topomyia yanbarensis TaxID=2498891 RepID=UPI00273BFC94|nr:uncharacterized protein LOC131680649 [Topomyia yanbarensis]